MPSRSVVRVAVVVAVTAVLSGCASTSGAVRTGPASSSSAPPLELRLVISSSVGPCSVVPLTSSGPGSACDETGATTYQLGAPLGEVTPTAVTSSGARSAAQTFTLQLDRAGSATLAAVTGRAVGSRLAILASGRVLGAPQVADPVTGGTVQLAAGTPAEAATVGAALHVPTAS